MSCLGCCSLIRLRRLASALAACAVRFKLPIVHVASKNIAIAFPKLSSAERTKLAEHSIASGIMTALEIIWFIKHPDKLESYIIPPSKEMLDLAIQTASIVCLPHLGNWEVFGQGAPLIGFKAAAVAETLSNATLDKLVTQTRERHGLRIIPREGAARKVLRALREDMAVGLLVDQNLSPSEGGEFISFFGLPATISPLPAVLARKLNINVFVAASVRNADGRFEIILEALQKPSTDYESDEELNQDIQKAFENIIRKYPEQYTWSYRRWRYIPGNIPGSHHSCFPDYASKKGETASEKLLENFLKEHVPC